MNVYFIDGNAYSFHWLWLQFHLLREHWVLCLNFMMMSYISIWPLRIFNSHVHLSSFVPDVKVWAFSSSQVFSVNSVFLALFNLLELVSFHLANFLWKPRVPSKVMAFAWLMVHKKVNPNDMLWLTRSFKALSPNWCILCRGSGETIDYLFLHHPIILGLRHRLFS